MVDAHTLNCSRVQAESKARKEEARLFHGNDLHNLEYMAMIEKERALLLLNQPPPVHTPKDARVRTPPLSPPPPTLPPAWREREFGSRLELAGAASYACAPRKTCGEPGHGHSTRRLLSTHTCCQPEPTRACSRA